MRTLEQAIEESKNFDIVKKHGARLKEYKNARNTTWVCKDGFEHYIAWGDVQKRQSSFDIRSVINKTEYAKFLSKNWIIVKNGAKLKEYKGKYNTTWFCKHLFEHQIQWGRAKVREIPLNILSVINKQDYAKHISKNWIIVKNGGKLIDYKNSTDTTWYCIDNFKHKLIWNDAKTKKKSLCIQTAINKTEYAKFISKDWDIVKKGASLKKYINDTNTIWECKDNFKYNIQWNNAKAIKSPLGILSVIEKQKYAKFISKDWLVIKEGAKLEKYNGIYDSVWICKDEFQHKSRWYSIKRKKKALCIKTVINKTEYAKFISKDWDIVKLHGAKVKKYIDNVKTIWYCPHKYEHPQRWGDVKRRKTPLNYTTLSKKYTQEEIEEYKKLNPYDPIDELGKEWLERVKNKKYGILYLIKTNQSLWQDQQEHLVFGLTSSNKKDTIEKVKRRYKQDFILTDKDILFAIQTTDKVGIQRIETLLKKEVRDLDLIPKLNKPIKGLLTESCKSDYSNLLIPLFNDIQSFYTTNDVMSEKDLESIYGKHCLLQTVF